MQYRQLGMTLKLASYNSPLAGVKDENVRQTTLPPLRSLAPTVPVGVNDLEYQAALDGDVLNSAGGNGVVNFTVRMPETIKNARLKGIGVAFGVDAKYVLNELFDKVQGSVAIFPPTLPNLFEDRISLLRQPILFSDVRMRDGRVLPKMSTSGYWVNASPEGKWTIKLSGLYGLPVFNPLDKLSTEQDAISRSSSMLQNVYLYLSLNAQTEEDTTKWSTLTW